MSSEVKQALFKGTEVRERDKKGRRESVRERMWTFPKLEGAHLHTPAQK